MTNAAARHKLSILLKQLRLKRGLSAQSVGNLVGMSQSKVSKTENGVTLPNSRDLQVLLNALGASQSEQQRAIEVHAEILATSKVVQQPRQPQEQLESAKFCYAGSRLPTFLQSQQYATNLSVNAKCDQNTKCAEGGAANPPQSVNCRVLLTDSAVFWPANEIDTVVANCTRLIDFGDGNSRHAVRLLRESTTSIRRSIDYQISTYSPTRASVEVRLLHGPQIVPDSQAWAYVRHFFEQWACALSEAETRSLLVEFVETTRSCE